MKKTIKWPVWLLALPLSAMVHAQTVTPIPTPAPSIIVDGGITKIALSEFTPITSTWAGRDVITAYEALIDVANKQAHQSLLFTGSASIETTWFAGNFAADVNVSCSGVPVGYDLAQGIRELQYSVPGIVNITELRHGVTDCKQLKIHIAKRGSLSRQFYTQVENIQVDFKIDSIRSVK
ncbi:hypothetical protein [Pseudoalteromonas sp. S2755]|uniref:hypothetical protein n=1 Tax=Pseudoalteromonas sp. S2755 TaxID=2066523 RepID=UPI00110B3A36|nr:hypothetical protein [Pseudoalteromonas sp. S2755]TMN35348.1 hypothetical protein CWC03_15510 [Pseudoalteromonas sp. S2755]